MILYNVTLTVDPRVHNEWLDWMKKEHIPEVMQTGLFVEYKLLKLIEVSGKTTDEFTYAVQYFLRTMEDYASYRLHFAPSLQNASLSKFGDKVLAFRTLLEVID